MSILAAETNVFPDNLLHESIDQADRQWWTIYTKARQEKALARELLRYEIPFYLPLVPNDNLIRGRRVRSFLPLFAGYVFLFGDDEERVKSLTTNRISQVLPVGNQAGLREDLHHIRQLIDSDAPLTIERTFSPGQRVRVKTGPMRGVEGMILSRRGKSRLLVSVNFLQQGASIEIDDFQVERI